MANIVLEIISNPIFSAAFFAWFIAQIIKMGILAIRKKKVTFATFFKSGGMPSSHAALVSALAASILFSQGATTAFYVALVFALIVIRDAVDVRYIVGLHSKTLNKLLLNQDKLKEYEGHTPIQASVGIIIGIICAIIAVKGYSFFFALRVFYLILPAVAANAAPVIANQLLPSWNRPVDFNAKFRGKPLLGRNKTWRGILASFAAIMIVVVIQRLLYDIQFFSDISFFSYSSTQILLMAIVVGAGVVAGDLVNSFVKRRLGISPGGGFFPWDQLDAVIGGMIAVIFFWVPTIPVIVTIILLAFILSFMMNGLKQDLKW